MSQLVYDRVFVTTSHNQKPQVVKLLEALEKTVKGVFAFICVESSSEVDYADLKGMEQVHVVRVPSNFFWAAATQRGIDYFFHDLQASAHKLVIMNCDVQLSSWDVLNQDLPGLHSFFSSVNGVITRSGFLIQNSLLAKHHYPCLGKAVSQVSANCHVQCVPTRCVVIDRECFRWLERTRIRCERLPHYGADYVFTYELGRACSCLWELSASSLILEDTSTTGIKFPSGGLVARFSLFFNRKSTFNLFDRYWYAIYVGRGNVFYVIASIVKCFMQVLRREERRS